MSNRLKQRPPFRQLTHGVAESRQRHPSAPELAYHVPSQTEAIAESYRILEGLKSTCQGLSTNDKRVTVLRKLRTINPFVFETVVLAAASVNNGWPVTWPEFIFDGGIDGSFFYEQQQWLLQAKRYTGPIHPDDVQAFTKIIHERNQAAGLFATTGIVPQTARFYERKFHTTLLILSGDDLVNFLLYPLN